LRLILSLVFIICPMGGVRGRKGGRSSLFCSFLPELVCAGFFLTRSPTPQLVNGRLGVAATASFLYRVAFFYLDGKATLRAWFLGKSLSIGWMGWLASLLDWLLPQLPHVRSQVKSLDGQDLFFFFGKTHVAGLSCLHVMCRCEPRSDRLG
jgi:hypothetical protein